jgi:hypothetical protein
VTDKKEARAPRGNWFVPMPDRVLIAPDRLLGSIPDLPAESVGHRSSLDYDPWDAALGKPRGDCE